MDIQEIEGEQLNDEDQKQEDVENLLRVEDRADVKAQLLTETQFLEENSQPHAGESSQARKVDHTPESMDKNPKNLRAILDVAGLTGSLPTKHVLTFLERLRKLEAPMQRFTNLVRAAEGLISPTAVSEATAHLSQHNFAVHQLALARNWSLLSSKRCSRAEVWASVQKKIGGTESGMTLVQFCWGKFFVQDSYKMS